MLLYFSVSNWGMIRDELNFSMVAEREQAHSGRLYPLSKFKRRVLPVAAIYGANASGKSTLIEALRFAQMYVLIGPRSRTDRIARKFYRLDKTYQNKPTAFSFVFEVDEDVFEYQFSVNDERVVAEELKQILSNDEKVIFSRNENGLVEMNEPLKSSTNAKAYIEGCSSNKLYVTNLINQGNTALSFVNQWFENIRILTPDQIFGAFNYYATDNSPLSTTGSQFFDVLKTGICGFVREEVPAEQFPVREEMKVWLRANPDKELPIMSPMRDMFVARWDSVEQRVRLYQIKTTHKSLDGNDVTFNVGLESDGTRRLMDLLPIFMGLIQTNLHARPFICFVDEIDRSLHPLLLKRVLSDYLGTLNGDCRSQLVFTTHNAELIDQNILRRDEINFLERNAQGAASLSRLSDYRDEKGKAVRFDALLQKRYMRGDFGGIPDLPMVNIFDSMDIERTH